jgi:hypothetical protein
MEKCGFLPKAATPARAIQLLHSETVSESAGLQQFLLFKQ